jgi:uncharacterized protein
VELPISSSRPETARSAGAKRAVERTCVGCGHEDEPESFLRFTIGPDAEIVADLQSRLGGRGAWAHPRIDCLTKACQRGFSKSFKAATATTLMQLGEQLLASSQRRLDGLLLAGAKRRCVIAGREAVKEVAAQAALVLLAEDAKSVAKDSTVMAIGQQGKVVIWGTKDHYGQLFGKTEVGVLALLEQGIAEAVEKTVSIARLGARARCGGGDARQLSEVR